MRWKRVLQKNWKCFFYHHVLCVLNTSTLPWTRQKAFPSTTCQSAVSPEPPNHSELRSPVPPPESSYNEPGWGAAGLSQDHRLLSAIRSPLIRRHAPRDYKWKRILQIRCVVGSYWKTIIGWGFCNIQNNQGRDRSYQPKPKDEADNPYQDHDCSEYYKAESNYCFYHTWTKKKVVITAVGTDNLFLNV